ncbi:MAG: ABC transporter permease, partial [Actinomycetota bacterium]|nr:ABC transporter permease [Actinomycetota bacterium]
MSEFFTTSVLVATVAAGFRLATPYLLAALGETLGQRSGVLNLGVDGVMLLGAFFAYWAVLVSGSSLRGMIAGALAGVVMGVVYAVVTVVFKTEQGISGIGIYLFGLGFSELIYRQEIGTPRPIQGFTKVKIPVLGDIKYVGQMFFKHSLVVYLALVLVPVIAFIFNHTRFGLDVRAVGETPEAADSLGVSVARTRTITILIGSTLACLGGAALALELV